MSRIVVVGDCLLDRDIDGTVDRVMPDGPAPVLEEGRVAERPGGAGLAAMLAAGDGDTVTLVTALSADPAGDTLRRLFDRAGVEVVDLGLDGPTPVKTRLRSDGHPLLRLDRGGSASPVGTAAARPLPDPAGVDAVLVSCYGRGVSRHPRVRAFVERATSCGPVVWDPHPRGPAPLAGVTLVTPNEREARRLVPEVTESGIGGDSRRARVLADRWQCGVVVTLGARGAVHAARQGLPLAVPAPAVVGADGCGAGDRFAVALAHALASRRSISDSVSDAVLGASAFVGDGGVAALRLVPEEHLPRVEPSWTSFARREADALAVARRTRDNGGIVVAAGGCFDLLHAGHAHLLQGARALGDCLVVCLNSDASVRRLKGDGRPVVPEDDRARLLLALAPVDAVLVFSEDTPVEALRRLRPDVFVKGGDYGSGTIPEEEALAAWGGQAVTVPYLHGRSTTRLVEEVVDHG